MADRVASWGPLALVFMAFHGPANAATVCHLQQFGEMTVKSIGPDLAVEAQVNGRPIWMILDTGSEATLLFRGAAEALGLRWSSDGGGTVYGVGGSTPLGKARIKDFRVAGITVRDFDLFVAGRLATPAAQGLLGGNFLLQADMEFDIPGGKVRFFKPKNCSGEQVVYWGGSYSVAPMLASLSDKVISVRVMVNGKPLRAEMDSGASVSTITSDAARRLNVRVSSPEAPPGDGMLGVAGESIATHVKVFPTFSFGDETIKNAKIEIADLFSGDAEIHLGSNIPQALDDLPEMLLGADFFRSHRIYVAMSQKKVYVSYVGGPVFQASPPLAK